MVCSTCGKEVHRYPSQIKRNKSNNVFCNRTCSTAYNNTHYRSGEDHPNFKTGITSYRGFVELKECNRCKYDKYPEILIVHHKDRNRKNNKVDNLEVLCPNCHAIEHKVIENK